MAHGTLVQESEGGIGPRLFHGVVAQSASASGVSVVSSSIGWLERPAKRRQLIPPQVLVPSSMKTWAFSSFTPNHKEGDANGVMVPEGRVHGGSLLSLLGGSLKDAVIDGSD